MQEELRELPGSLGERIAYFRKQEGMTQAVLAEKLDISAQAVSKWESGISCPDIMMLAPLSKIFGVSTDVLLGVGSAKDQTLCEEPKESVHVLEPVFMDDTSKDKAFGENREEEESNWLMPLPETIGSLRIDVGAIEVEIREGEQFLLRGIGIRRDDLSNTVEDGVWKISSRIKAITFIDFRNMFGKKKLVITFPKGFHFDGIRIKLGAGSLSGRGLCGASCRVDVGAGDLRLEDLEVETAQIQCGMGSARLWGSITGHCRLECGMGSIRMRLKKQGEFGYRASVGLGDIAVDQQRLSGAGHQKFNSGAHNFFDIICGMGSVKVDFED